MFFGYRKTVEALRGLGESREIPSAAEVAEAMGISESDAEMARQYFMGADVDLWEEHDDSRSSDVSDASGSGHGLAVLSDRQGASEAPRPDEAAENDERSDVLARIQSVLPLLSPRHRRVLQARHLSEKPEALSVLAKEWSVSMERVRQIDRAALLALRAALEKKSIAGSPEKISEKNTESSPVSVRNRAVVASP
jgi:RNA polymerase sigma-32 factor